MEVENDFSNLLSKLSSKNEKSESESSTSEIPVMSVNRSLEEQSKKSKSRVHYQKFTRGKDLSRYSKKDLECIFGVSSKSLESKHEENQNFVQSGNMQEYFSKKNVKNRKSDSESHISPTEKVDQLNDNNESEDVPKKKKKKGKKRKHEDTEFNEDINREIEGQEIEDDNTETSRKDEKEFQTKESKKNTEPVDIVEDESVENSPLKVKKKKKKKSKSELVIPQLDGTYDSSEVEEFMVEPTEHLESNCCIANIGETYKENTHLQQISQKSSCKTSKKRTKLNKNPCVLDKVKSVLEALPLSKEETVPNLNEKNEEMSKHVDAIVQAKINTYLSQVLNRKEKNTNPVREMKEKKKKMIQDDVSCVQFSGSNLCSISGYTCY